MSEKKKVCKVKFYSFSGNGACFSEVELPSTGRIIRGIRITPTSDGISCVIPPSLAGKWNFKEMEWEQVVSRVTFAYHEMQNSIRSIEETNTQGKKTKPAENHKATNKDKGEFKPTFSFSAPERKMCAVAQILFGYSRMALKDVFVQINLEDESMYVAPPIVFENAKDFDNDKWEKVADKIKSEFRKQVLGSPEEDDEEAFDGEITFEKIEEFIVCTGDVLLYENGRPFKGFKLKLFGNGRVEVVPPVSIGRWEHPRFSWGALRAGFERALKKELNIEVNENAGSTSEQKKKNERTYYGRIKNAEHSDFVYYPHTMLRPDTNVEETNERKTLGLLATALSKGTRSGIGPFEINALWWVSKLRYVTSTMLLDLAAHGYISLGWRDSISSSKLADITRRMCTYNMIIRSRFCCLDENGDETDSSKSVSRIMTLAPNGSILLKELGKDVNKYNPFTVLQDGNTVKRYLAANQWLIYWLKAYKERVGENYESAVLLQRKGEEFSMARIYAYVTVDDVTMVAEPVRRVDEFEAKENERWLLDKLDRMMKVFNNIDQIYSFNIKMNFPSRPIIVLLCEDDEHIKLTIETLSGLMEENPEQKFWFSTDLRVFNMDYIGNRFLELKNGKLEVVDMAEYFGCDDEIEQEKLVEKFIKDNEAENTADYEFDEYPEGDFEDYLDDFSEAETELFDSDDSNNSDSM